MAAPLIETARAAGTRVLTAGMCAHQAAESFRLFAGIQPDVARMRRTFAAALAVRDAAQAPSAAGGGLQETATRLSLAMAEAC